MTRPSTGIVIIPAFNEEKTIGSVLADLAAHVPQLDVVVIDDGSRDRTADVVRAHGVRLLRLPFNLHYGAALQTGFKWAVDRDYAFVIQFDADGQHRACEIPRLLQGRADTGGDIVIGARTSQLNAPWWKRAGLSGLRSLFAVLSGVRLSDPTSGLQLLSHRAFSRYARLGHFPPDYPDVDVLLASQWAGMRIVEVPVSMEERSAGLSMHAGPRVFYYLFKMALSVLVVALRTPRFVFEGRHGSGI